MTTPHEELTRGLEHVAHVVEDSEYLRLVCHGIAIERIHMRAAGQAMVEGLVKLREAMGASTPDGWDEMIARAKVVFGG